MRIITYLGIHFSPVNYQHCSLSLFPVEFGMVPGLLQRPAEQADGKAKLWPAIFGVKLKVNSSR